MYQSTGVQSVTHYVQLIVALDRIQSCHRIVCAFDMCDMCSWLKVACSVVCDPPPHPA